MDDVPHAPASRPDLAKTWATVAEMEKRSDAGYQTAARRIRRHVAAYETIGVAELAEIQQLIDAELKALEQQQNTLLMAGMLTAAAAATQGRYGERMDARGDALLVRHLLDTPQPDGLNLSARLWRIHAGAASDMKSIVNVAVQRGWSAEHALRHSLEVTPELHQALKDAGAGTVAARLETGLLADPGNAAMKFRRVLRTEINRAHGERYKQMVRDDADAIGLRFMLSPRHPRVDVCDTHASADLYGLGPGVYPVDACPWPAHPNTFSYVEAVFADELGSPNPSARKAPENLPETLLKIRQKRNWTDTFKARAESLYNEFDTQGVLLSDHAAARILQRAERKGFSTTDVLDILTKQQPNFEDIDSNRLIYFSQQHKIAVFKSKTDGAVITLTTPARAKSVWKPITPDTY